MPRIYKNRRQRVPQLPKCPLLSPAHLPVACHSDRLDSVLCSISVYQIVLLGMLSSDSSPTSPAMETFSISTTDFAKKLNRLHALVNRLRAEGYVALSLRRALTMTPAG